MHGPTCVFWANLTPFSLETDEHGGYWKDGTLAALVVAFAPQVII
jgi:hypothetical protein